MPTYDYECTKCGHKFELEERISAPPSEECPECGGKLMRVISGGGGVILKGDGFYTTDYRSEAYKKAAKADKTEPGSSSKSKKSGGEDG
jgi:putative FmdB family regulatory protein